MANVLICWIGMQDLAAAGGQERAGVGPIGRALEERQFDEVDLLSDHSEEKTAGYVNLVSVRKW